MKRLQRLILILALASVSFALFIGTGSAQQGVEPGMEEPATGGVLNNTTPTLADILARQRGVDVDNSGRRAQIGSPEGAAPVNSPLGTLGGASDPDLWRAMRFDEADVTTQIRGPASRVLIQDSGMWWLEFRKGPLLTYGGYLLLATIAILAVFYLVRGRIRIDGPVTGHKLLRFKGIERFGHWLLAGSFILLSLTGLITLMGRKFLIPAFGLEAFSTLAIASKWIHNNVSWAFMLGLIMVFVMWVIHNLPDRTDINWLLKGGGIFSKGHPPAKKFNAGQKLIFWAVIILGVSISVSGLSLLFPFEMPMFAATFEKVNAVGLPGLFGYGPLPTDLAPHQEMQYSQLWHAIVGFLMMAVILGHIYIGTIGMEGAYEAMGKGTVEEQWAKEHHSLWVEEVKSKEGQAPQGATPAE